MLNMGIDFMRDLGMGDGCWYWYQFTPGVCELVAVEISLLTGETFNTAPNKFHSLTSKDEVVAVHGMMKAWRLI